MLEFNSTKSVLKQLNLFNDFDYIRKSSVNYTDLYINQIKESIEYGGKNSNYICLFHDNDKNKIVPIKASLYDIYDQINDIWLKGDYKEGFDYKNQRIKVHLGKDGEMWVGNKGGPHFFINYQAANLATLFDAKNKISSHQDYQNLLLQLGTKLGFSVKVANGDRGKTSNNKRLMDLNTIEFKDIELNNIVQNKDTEKTINNIDVTWVNRISNKVEYAFEVELSRNYREAIGKFVDLVCYTNYSHSLNCILITPRKELMNVKSAANLDRFNILSSKKLNLYYSDIAMLKDFNNLISKDFRNIPTFYIMKRFFDGYSKIIR